jgi:hypothetical protein
MRSQPTTEQTAEELTFKEATLPKAARRATRSVGNLRAKAKQGEAISLLYSLFTGW